MPLNQQADALFAVERGTGIMNEVQMFLVHKTIISAVRSAVPLSDRVSHIILRGCWCGTIVLNVHAPAGGKIDRDSVRNWNASRNLTVDNTTFAHHNIHNFTWLSPDVKTKSSLACYDGQEQEFKGTWCLIIQGKLLWYYCLVVVATFREACSGQPLFILYIISHAEHISVLLLFYERRRSYEQYCHNK